MGSSYEFVMFTPQNISTQHLLLGDKCKFHPGTSHVDPEGE